MSRGVVRNRQKIHTVFGQIIREAVVIFSLYSASFVCLFQEQGEEEQFGPKLVAELAKHGVNATDIKKLQVGLSLFIESKSIKNKKIVT